MYLEAFAHLDIGVVERLCKRGNARFVVGVEGRGYLPDLLLVGLFLRPEPRCEARVFVDLCGLDCGPFERRPDLRCGFVAGDARQYQFAVLDVVVGREFSCRGR